MAAYPIPNPQYGIYNPNNFSKQTSNQDALTVETGKLYFLQFPNAQTTQTEFLHSIGVASDATFNGPVTFNETVTYNTDIEFTANVTVDGDATLLGNFLGETGTFQDVLTCEKGIDISVAPYGITFPDNTTQTTAFIEANYAQLNTDNIFLAPYKNVFQGNNSTNATNAPLQISNVDNSDNVSLYIDPSPTVDLTLYSAQSNGGLTVRNPTASFTLNPVTISPGVVGARSLNPIDMNDNYITGASYVTSPFFNVGANGQISCDPNNNPTILVIRNSSTNPSAQIYFQMFNSGGTAYSPMNISSSSVSCNIPLNLTNGSDINMGTGSDLALGANSITGTGTINANTYNINTYGKIDQTGANNGTVIANNAPYVNGAQATIAFNLNGPGGVVNPLKIYNDGLNCTVNINMNNANINGINTLTGYAGGNITLGSYINMNSNNILNCGSGSTAYTQPIGTSNTSIATTAYVQNMFVTQTIGVAANNAYYAIQPSFNTFVASYIALDNSQYQVTINTILATSNPIVLVSNSTMPVNTVNTITLTYTSGTTVPWASPSGTAFGKIILENSDLGTQISPRITLYNNALIITLPTLSYLSPSTNYNIYIVKNNVTV